MLRIIAGDKKGRALRSLPKSHPVRPLLARIKKSLFDILTPFIPEARFLDLYAGTGAVGIEALSRGAAHATFVDLDRECIEVIEHNLGVMSLLPKATLFKADVLGDLSILPKPYNLIFIGTPYVDRKKKPLALLGATLAGINRADLLSAKGIIIAQHHKKEAFELPSSSLEIRRVERYGDTVLSFIKKTS